MNVFRKFKNSQHHTLSTPQVPHYRQQHNMQPEPSTSTTAYPRTVHQQATYLGTPVQSPASYESLCSASSQDSHQSVFSFIHFE